MLIPIAVNAQLEVAASDDATVLIETLIGSDVTYSNPQLVCPENGGGTFNGINSNIGLDGGILLTTGRVNLAVGPNNNDDDGANDGQMTNQDPDLEDIVFPFEICDNCVLEFDFEGEGSMLSFTYVFGSEEYPEYFCGTFNDVFGFFITGPNPAGGTYNAENIALILGTNLPVTINNLGPGECHGVDNSQF